MSLSDEASSAGTETRIDRQGCHGIISGATGELGSTAQRGFAVNPRLLLADEHRSALGQPISTPQNTLTLKQKNWLDQIFYCAERQRPRQLRARSPGPFPHFRAYAGVQRSGRTAILVGRRPCRVRWQESFSKSPLPQVRFKRPLKGTMRPSWITTSCPDLVPARLTDRGKACKYGEYRRSQTVRRAYPQWRRVSHYQSGPGSNCLR